MASSKRVGYAVVGLGGIAQVAVLPAFRHSRKAKLIALVSGDERKAKRLAAKFGASSYYTYDDYALCLSNPEVEAVYITTPPAVHPEHTLPAATAGKHVLCEKPMAATIEECQRMIEACRTNRVRLMIAYRKYFDPASLALKQIVKSGKLGRLKTIHSAFTAFLPPGAKAPAWHFSRKLAGGGALVDVGVYCVNTVRWLTGREPVEAMGYNWSVDPTRYREVEENNAFRLTFPNGLVLQASSSYGAALSSFLQVHGEKGWAALNPAFVFHFERRLFGQLGGRWFEKKFKAIDEFALELDAFADCIRRKRDPEPDGKEGLRDVVVMQAIYRSTRENRPVPIHVPFAAPG